MRHLREDLVAYLKANGGQMLEHTRVAWGLDENLNPVRLNPQPQAPQAPAAVPVPANPASVVAWRPPTPQPRSMLETPLVVDTASGNQGQNGSQDANANCHDSDDDSDVVYLGTWIPSTDRKAKRTVVPALPAIPEKKNTVVCFQAEFREAPKFVPISGQNENIMEVEDEEDPYEGMPVLSPQAGPNSAYYNPEPEPDVNAPVGHEIEVAPGPQDDLPAADLNANMEQEVVQVPPGEPSPAGQNNLPEPDLNANSGDEMEVVQRASPQAGPSSANLPANDLSANASESALSSESSCSSPDPMEETDSNSESEYDPSDSESSTSGEEVTLSERQRTLRSNCIAHRRNAANRPTRNVSRVNYEEHSDSSDYSESNFI